MKKNYMKIMSMLLVCLLMLGGVTAAFAESEATAEPEATAASEVHSDDEMNNLLYTEDGQPLKEADKIESNDNTINEELSDEWWNILLLGGDSRSNSSYSRTDAIMVLSVNLGTKEMKISSIMRDSWVNIAGSGYNKINAANVFGGPELAIQTVNECFDLNVTDYAMVNFYGISSVIDMLGGVKMDITDKEKSIINSGLLEYSNASGSYVKLNTYGEGIVLTGDQALAYARNRMLDNDYERTARQRKLIVALANQLQETDPLTLAKLVMKSMEYLNTNLSLESILDLANVGMQFDMNAIEELRIPVDGSYDSGMYGSVWCIKMNLAKNTEALHAFIYGDGQ